MKSKESCRIRGESISMRVLIVSALVIAMGGCQTRKSTRFGRSQSRETTTAGATQPGSEGTSEPATNPDSPDGEVIVYVDAEPIYMGELNDLLIRDYGAGGVLELITSKIVAREGRKHNITITDDDLVGEEEDMMVRAFGFLDDLQQRRRLLDQELARRRISDKHWKMVLRRNAILTGLAEKQTTVSDKDIQEQFAEMYAPKVQVRHIQTDSLENAQRVLRELSEGGDFVTLARKFSTNRSSRGGGLLPPFGKDSVMVPPLVRDTAMQMKSVGELSRPIQVGTAFHVLRLERIIDAQDAKLEDVREKVETEARKRKLRSVRNRILRDLVRRARIEYVNPVLKAQARQERLP